MRLAGQLQDSDGFGKITGQTHSLFQPPRYVLTPIAIIDTESQGKSGSIIRQSHTSRSNTHSGMRPNVWVFSSLPLKYQAGRVTRLNWIIRSTRRPARSILPRS